MLTPEERAQLTEDLEASRHRLLAAIRGVSELQWLFKADPESWSIAECVSHLSDVEARVVGQIQRMAASDPPQPELSAAVTGKENLIRKAVPNRTRRVKAPADLPHPRAESADTAISRFDQTRSLTIDYVTSTSDDVRSHGFAHFVFKELDGFQWLLLIAQHSHRHTSQIEEIKAHPAFPAS